MAYLFGNATHFGGAAWSAARATAAAHFARRHVTILFVVVVVVAAAAAAKTRKTAAAAAAAGGVFARRFAAIGWARVGHFAELRSGEARRAATLCALVPVG